jgi:hypothetical protein
VSLAGSVSSWVRSMELHGTFPMSEHELAEWAEDFAVFCARCAGLFTRGEGREKSSRACETS